MPRSDGSFILPSWIPRDIDVDRGGRSVIVARRHTDVANISEWFGTGLTVWFAGDLEQLHRELAMLGPFDCIIDACAGGAAWKRFKCVLHHLGPGGRGVVRLDTATRSSDRLYSNLTAVLDLGASGELVAPVVNDRRPRPDREVHALAASLADFKRGDEVLVFTQTRELHARISESDLTEQAFMLRPTLGTVLATEPAQTYSALGSFNSSDPEESRPAVVKAPLLTLREYRNVICAPRMICVADGLVLPDSFRHPQRPFLMNPALTPWDSDSAEVSIDGEPTPLPGNWFYADNIMRGHFGHAMTEQLSKLWGWLWAAERWPDLRLLVMARDGAEELADWERELFAAAGVPSDKITLSTRPVTVQRLVSGTPAYEIDAYIHPIMAPIYQRTKESLLGGTSPASGPKRIFLTRQLDRRACNNQAQVHRLFEEHDFQIILPETLALSEQVALFESADIVAGFGGSALFHLALTSSSKTVIALSHDNYHLANEKQIAALNGHDLHVFRSEADEPRQDQFTNRAFHSTFTFNFDREGRSLVSLLTDLAPRRA